MESGLGREWGEHEGLARGWRGESEGLAGRERGAGGGGARAGASPRTQLFWITLHVYAFWVPS